MNADPDAANRDNAFDLIRLLLAVLVVYSHAHLVGGFGDEGFYRLCRMQTGAGTLAVTGFFGISGFLVTRSYAMRARWLPFARARLLRIVPGYYFSLVLTAFALAPLIARMNAAGGPWDGASAFRFVWENASVRYLDNGVGDILHGLPYAVTMNGALWSLFPELCCYALVLLLGVLGWIRSGRLNVLLVCLAALALHAAVVLEPQVYFIAPTFLQLPALTPYVAAFAVGSSAYCLRERMGIGSRAGVAWLGFAGVLLAFGGWALLGPAVLTLGIIHAAYLVRIRLSVDLSYGTYLLHYPALQLLAALGWNRHGFTAYFSAGLAVTLALAAVSWFAVERPALRLKG
jgi:peptidoglycan/LPS O-acetylase OafA/YrhL